MHANDTRPRYKTRQIGEVEVFYREAGPANAPVILLLHGFPTASHMFRDLIPLLADRYRLIAPDLPGFGQTKAPPRGQFDYRFERLADVIEAFTEALSLDRYALYIFDYGAPVGLRLATRQPKSAPTFWPTIDLRRKPVGIKRSWLSSCRR
jgi:pimeloyl-ACP methyl ester carboxylesterase